MYETGECVTAEYSANANGTVKVVNTEFFGFYDGSDDYGTITGKAEVNNWYPGDFAVGFFGDIGADYRVIDTDYTSYAIVYSCTEFLGLSLTEQSWVLVRDQIEDGSAEFNSMIDDTNAIYATKLPEYDPETRMRTTQQGTGCTYNTN